MILVGLSVFLIPIEIVSRWDLLWSHLHLYGMKDPWEHFSQHSHGFIPVGLSFSIIRFKIWMKVALHWWLLLSKRPPIQWPLRCLFVHLMSFSAIVFQVSLQWRTGNNSLWSFSYFLFIGIFCTWIWCWATSSLVISWVSQGFGARFLEFSKITSQ